MRRFTQKCLVTIMLCAETEKYAKCHSNNQLLELIFCK